MSGTLANFGNSTHYWYWYKWIVEALEEHNLMTTPKCKEFWKTLCSWLAICPGLHLQWKKGGVSSQGQWAISTWSTSLTIKYLYLNKIDSFPSQGDNSKSYPVASLSSKSSISEIWSFCTRAGWLLLLLLLAFLFLCFGGEGELFVFLFCSTETKRKVFCLSPSQYKLMEQDNQ